MMRERLRLSLQILRGCLASLLLLFAHDCFAQTIREKPVRRNPPLAVVEGEFVIKFKTSSSATILPMETVKTHAALSALDIREIQSIGLPNTYLVKFDASKLAGGTADAIAGIASNKDLQSQIEYIVPNYQVYAERTPNDSDFNLQWAMQRIGAEQGWDRLYESSSILVGVVDTGIDYTQADLAGSLWPNNQPSDADDEDHGTHVSGTIAATGNNRSLVTGVTWSTQLMSLKFLDSNGRGTTAAAVSAIMRGLNQGARILNNSWGGGGYFPPLRDAIAEAERRGVLFVAAAGNDSSNNDGSPHFPSNYDIPNVLSIMSTDEGDNRSRFSNYGTRTVHLAAPGSNIISTWRGGGAGYMSGTSMATPHVSGAAALLLAQNPNWNYVQVKLHLMASADRIPALNGLSQTGARLNIARALWGPVRLDMAEIKALPIKSDLQLRWQNDFDSPACSHIDLLKSTDDGATFVFEKTLPNSGEAKINVGSKPTSRAFIRMRCANSNIYVDTQSFKIFAPLAFREPIAPNGVAKRSWIEFEWDGSTSQVFEPGCELLTLEYGTSKAGPFMALQKKMPNSGHAKVRIPNLAGLQSILRLRCEESATFADSAPFRVFTPLRVAYPLGHTEWAMGSLQRIQWNGSIAQVSPFGCDKVSLRFLTKTSTVTLIEHIDNTGLTSVRVPYVLTDEGSIELQCDASPTSAKSQGSIATFVALSIVSPRPSARMWASGSYVIQWNGDLAHGGQRSCKAIDIVLRTAHSDLHLAWAAPNHGYAEVPFPHTCARGGNLRLYCSDRPGIASSPRAVRLHSPLLSPICGRTT